MLKGTVKFHARIRGNGVTFPLLRFNPKEPGIEKIEMEGPTGNEILSTVHLVSVATEEDGKNIAMKVHTAALNRISFFHGFVIENGQMTDSDFSPVNPPPGFHLGPKPAHFSFIGHDVRFVVGLSASRLKEELEHASPPGEQNFGLFRSARQSMSPVEEFMHLYHILLMLFDDKQSAVDAFIVGQEPAVPQTPDPRPGHTNMETVNTRLRNELGHKRTGVNLDHTKAEMAHHLSGLTALTKRAIELYG